MLEAKENTESNDPKTELELEKLVLERRVLQRQLSTQGILLEWLKAAAVPVTLLGAILAFYIGFGQLKQSGEAQTAERFDKALTRLASEQPDQRMTGVEGIRLFLRVQEPEWHLQALSFLINTLALEKNTQVQGAILDAIVGIKPGQIEASSLNEALNTAVERNRSLARSILDSYKIGIQQNQWLRLAKFGLPDFPRNTKTGPIPEKLISELSFKQYLDFISAEHSPFDDMRTEEGVPLSGLSAAISALIRAGAKVTDFRGIYCRDCDFTPAKNLDGVNFDDSYLPSTDFSHLSLKQATFRNANLTRSIFFAADLTGADLSEDFVVLDFYGVRRGFPYLECANLRGADLSGLALAEVYRYFSTIYSGDQSQRVLAPRLLSVQIDNSTKMKTFDIVILTEVSDEFLKKYPTHPEVARLSQRSEMRDDPFFGGFSYEIHLWRSLDDDPSLAATNYTITSKVDDGAINRLLPGSKLLRGFLDQPPLAPLQIVAKFNAALGANDQGAPGSVSKRASDAKVSCNEPGHPKVFDLMLRATR
jgi:hypothetical protein